MRFCVSKALRLTFVIAAGLASAEPIPISGFYEGNRIVDVSISPDARYLAMVIRNGGRSYLAVRDRSTTGKLVPILSEAEGSKFLARSCSWASSRRIYCRMSPAYMPPQYMSKDDAYFAVNPDGSGRTGLFKSNPYFAGHSYPRIVDSLPGDGAHVLGVVDSFDTYLPSKADAAAYFLMDVNTGDVGALGHFPPGHSWSVAADAARMSLVATRIEFRPNGKFAWAYAKNGPAEKWQQLRKVEAHQHDSRFTPISIDPNGRDAYMLMDHQGRVALWRVDMADEREPQLVFWHTDLNVDFGVLSDDNRLLGASLDTSAIGPSYFDPEAAAIDSALRSKWPDHMNFIVGTTPDMKAVVVRSWSKDGAPRYRLVLNSGDKIDIENLGSEYPQLDGKSLPETRTVVIPLSKGGHIFGEWTRRGFDESHKNKLVVLVGDWDTGRRAVDPLAKLLADRGYAVLRPNYKSDSRFNRYDLATFADWGGQIYEAILDSARWAHAQPGVDSQDDCIVGVGYGGYVALLGATRGDNGFERAVSIKGLSDLAIPRERNRTRELAKLHPENWKAEVSPRKNASQAHAHVLLIHEGDSTSYWPDVPPRESKLMAKALQRDGKPHRVVAIDGEGESFDAAAFQEVIGFLEAPKAVNGERAH